MAKEDNEIEVEGIVRETVRGKFMVEIVPAGLSDSLPEQKHLVMAYLSGKLKKNMIRIVEGDRVKLGLSPYDLTRGRITYRMK